LKLLDFIRNHLKMAIWRISKYLSYTNSLKSFITRIKLLVVIITCNQSFCNYM
jgi:hypothetical protein